MKIAILSPKQLYDKYKSIIPVQTKVAFFSALIIGFITHAYGFINLMPSFDNVQATMVHAEDMLFQGRWFQKYAALITSQYNMPWVNGIISILLLSFAITIIVALFKFKKTSSVILTVAILVSFPTIASNFSYLYMTDAFMVALLFSVLAVYISRRFVKFGFLISAIFICLSLGIYQAYICLSVALFVILPMISLIDKEKTNKEILFQGLKDIASLVIGVGLYYLMLKILLNYNNVELTNYQNIDQLNNVQILNFLPRIKEAYKGFFRYFTNHLFYYYSKPIAIANIVVGVLSILYIAVIFIKQKVYKDLVSFVIFVMLVGIMPLAIYSIGLISAQGIHYLMIFPFSIIYVVLIKAGEDVSLISKNINVKNLTLWLTMLVAIIIFFSNFIFANKSYLVLKVRFNQSYAYATKLSVRIESDEDFHTGMPIAICGYSTVNHYLDSKLTGFNFKGRYMINKPISFYNFMWDYIGSDYNLVSTDELNKIMETAEYKAMPIYPENGSIKDVDGIFVVKLS